MGNFIRNASIGVKIYSMVGILVLLSIFIGAIGLNTLREYNKQTSAIINSSRRAQLGEQINALVLSVVADSRGIYMSATPEEANKYAPPLVASLKVIQEKIAEQQSLLPKDRATELDEIAAKVDEFVKFRTELARLSQQVGVAEARLYGDNDANRNNRKKLNELIVAGAAENAKEVDFNKKEITDLQRHAMWIIGSAIVIGAAFGAIMGWVVATFGIIKPLFNIRESMIQLAAGNLEVEVPGEERQDEVGGMARAVSVFKRNAVEKDALDRSAKNEQRAKEERQARIDALLKKFDSTAAEVVSSVSAASTELSLTAEQMTGVAARTSEQSQQVSAASNETSQNVQSVAGAAEEMAATVREIASQVSRSTAVVNEAMGRVDAADGSARELVKASQSIGAITVLIESIAGQINLLALNATIESARAGEAGKGFAVVASEVKNLATQATRATEQIREQLSSVQSMSETVAGELVAVKESVSKVSEYSATIAAAVEEQSAATNEIVNNMQTAAFGVDQINRNVENIRESADTTSDSTRQVLDAAKLLSHQSEQLDMEVRHFLQNIQVA